MIKRLNKIPDDKIREMLRLYAFDELWKIVQKVCPDISITKKQFGDEIKKIQESDN